MICLRIPKTIARLSLPHQLSVNGSVVTLPQICQWHLKSFDKKQGMIFTNFVICIDFRVT